MLNQLLVFEFICFLIPLLKCTENHKVSLIKKILAGGMFKFEGKKMVTHENYSNYT